MSECKLLNWPPEVSWLNRFGCRQGHPQLVRLCRKLQDLEGRSGASTGKFIGFLLVPKPEKNQTLLKYFTYSLSSFLFLLRFQVERPSPSLVAVYNKVFL